MARGFGATLGAGSTDALTTAYAGNHTILSFFLKAYRNGDGGGGLGRFFAKGSNTPHFYNNPGASAFVFDVGWSGTTGTWTVPRNATGAFADFFIGYDGSSVANDPIIDINGVSQTVTRSVAPVGTILTSAENYVLGNRTDGIRNWDGQLCEWALWSRVLNSTERALLAAGWSPASIKSGLVAYVHARGESSPEPELIVPGNVTVTGTAAQTHPTVKQPVMNLSGLLSKKLTGRLL